MCGGGTLALRLLPQGHVRIYRFGHRPQGGRFVKTLSVVLIALMFAGCATAQSPSTTEQSAQPTTGDGQSATFRHPVTGEVKVCTENSNTGAAWALICIPCWISAYKSEYAGCESRLEEVGYSRVTAAETK